VKGRLININSAEHLAAKKKQFKRLKEFSTRIEHSIEDEAGVQWKNLDIIYVIDPMFCLK
jgi:hypothetical protein